MLSSQTDTTLQNNFCRTWRRGLDANKHPCWIIAGLEWLLVLYIAGLTWRKAKIAWRVGRQKYFSMHWHK